MDGIHVKKWVNKRFVRDKARRRVLVMVGSRAQERSKPWIGAFHMGANGPADIKHTLINDVVKNLDAVAALAQNLCPVERVQVL